MKGKLKNTNKLLRLLEKFAPYCVENVEIRDVFVSDEKLAYRMRLREDEQ